MIEADGFVSYSCPSTGQGYASIGKDDRPEIKGREVEFTCAFCKERHTIHLGDAVGLEE